MVSLLMVATAPELMLKAVVRASAAPVVVGRDRVVHKRELGSAVDIGAVEANVVQATSSSPITVHGTDAADGIYVGRNAAGADIVSLDTVAGVEFSVNFTSTPSITVNALDGDDAVSVDSAITKPTTIEGGIGDDLLVGGNGDDTIVGGLGADILDGGGGNDDLYGSVQSSVVLNDGADTLLADSGGDDLHVDFLRPVSPQPYTPAGGDIIKSDGNDNIFADSGGYAPAPTGSTWQQNMLWNGNYGFGALICPRFSSPMDWQVWRNKGDILLCLQKVECPLCFPLH
jgi:hypothetical protein